MVVPVSGDLSELELRRTVLLAFLFFPEAHENHLVLPVSLVPCGVLCCQELGSFSVETLVKG